jgi:hypothetical protein
MSYARPQAIIAEFYEGHPDTSSDFARIVSQRQWKRLVDQLDAPENRKCIVVGGERNKEDRCAVDSGLQRCIGTSQ